MKILLSLFLIIFSLIMAHLKASELKNNIEISTLLCRLSNKLKSNFSGEMLPAHAVAENIFNEQGDKNIYFSSVDQLVSYMNEKYSSLPFLKDYTEVLSRLPYLSSDELIDNIEKLNAISEKALVNAKECYNKDGKNAYILFPGIISVFVLILV